jgi:hypothetical protein
MTPEDFAKLPELVRLLIVGEAAKRVSHHPKAYSMSRKVKDLALFEMARRNYGLLDEISHLRSELDLWKTREILQLNASNNRVDIISELGGENNNDKKTLQDELDKANRTIAELKVQLRTEREDREKRQEQENLRRDAELARMQEELEYERRIREFLAQALAVTNTVFRKGRREGNNVIIPASAYVDGQRATDWLISQHVHQSKLRTGDQERDKQSIVYAEKLQRLFDLTLT